jgi:hypothetical protein
MTSQVQVLYTPPLSMELKFNSEGYFQAAEQHHVPGVSHYAVVEFGCYFDECYGEQQRHTKADYFVFKDKESWLQYIEKQSKSGPNTKIVAMYVTPAVISHKVVVSGP